MWSFRLARALRRLQKPSVSSSSPSLFLDRSILSSLPYSSHPTTRPNPDYYVPFRQYYRLTPSFELSRQDFKFSSAFIPVAYISTSVRESSKREEDGGGSSKAQASWIDLYLPKQARPYARLARLDKPIGTWLLAWPCMWYNFFSFSFFSFSSLWVSFVCSVVNIWEVSENLFSKTCVRMLSFALLDSKQCIELLELVIMGLFVVYGYFNLPMPSKREYILADSG